MRILKHYAIYGEIPAKKNLLQKVREVLPAVLNGKKVAEFSNAELQKHLEDDHRHGRSELVDSGRSLSSYSAGERKKVLLEYLLQQQPDLLILDNPFDSLDRESVEGLRLRLEQLSKELQVIQLFNRKEDLLSFIQEVFQLNNGQLTLSSATDFKPDGSSEGSFSNINELPAAPVQFKDVPEELVRLNGVSVKYEGRPVLTNINWEVKKGGFWKLSGPNGAGKTTLLSMIYGDNPKAYGQELFLFGNRKGSGESVWELKKKIGYFSPNLTEFFNRRNTVLEMLVSGLLDSVGLYQKPSRQQIDCARDWLKLLKMEDLAQKVFLDLPLLQQRILLIARAMIKHPPLLILDEPTAALNDEQALKVAQLVNLIAKSSETAIIFVSHREEKGLEAEKKFLLVPGTQGSVGKLV